MQNQISSRFANSAAALCCLLTLIALPAWPQLAAAQVTAPQSATSTPLRGSTETLPGHTASQVLNGTAIRISHYNPEQKLRLALAVQRPHPAEEEKFLQELQTKGSPNFHKFLSAKEWNARFAPSVEDEQKVVDWAVSQGLTVTNRFANRLLVDVEAPAGVIEKVFGVTINNYQVGDEVDFANDRDPQIPANLSGVLFSVQGLNSIQRFHRLTAGARKTRGPDYAAGPVYSTGEGSQGDGDSGKGSLIQGSALASGGITPKPEFTGGNADPADIPYSSQSYDYSALYAQGHCCNPHNDSGGSPPDSSIALVTYGNYQGSDVNTFFQTYGLAWNWTPLYVDGTNNPGTECNVGASGCPGDGQDDEAPLDVEYSTASANSFGSYLDTAHVYVYEAANGLYSTYEDVFNFIVSDNHANVVSTSYGGSEADFENGNGTAIFSTMHGIFNSMAGQGFTLIAASGDNGATMDCTNQDRVGYPASDPDFVAAGGTRITFNSDGTFSNEVAWTGVDFSYPCGNNWGGGGGGVSVDFSQPYWQSGFGGSQRLLPDISLNADPYGTEQNYYYNGSMQGVGGTSIVAPELAGFFAQENAYLAAIGSICGSGTSACEPIGNPSPVIYEEAKDKNAAHYPFYDVTQGCNSNYYTSIYGLGYYCAGAGYDEATGWGSINALQLAWAINWEVIPAYGEPYITWSGPATNKWYNTNQTVSWVIHDYVPSGSTPGTGIAGESQGWDSIPADPTSEATPGSGNSFYSGPQFHNDSTGCLAFEPNGCAGGVAQGCHTAYARGWNNQGWSTTGNSGYPESYGPICYDTVAPTISLATNPVRSASGWSTRSVTVTLTAADSGGSGASGVAHTYYGISSSGCNTGSLGSCYIYGSPVIFTAQGLQVITAFSEDNAGNFSSVVTSIIAIDETAPVSTLGLSGSLVANTWESAVTVVLKATDNLSGVAATYYTLDGGATTKYTGSFSISTVGSHTVKYWSVDVAGNTETANNSTFTLTSPTTTSLTSSPNPSLNGHAILLTAKVTPSLIGTPTGTVTFKNGTTVLGAGTLSSGVATFAISTLPAGTDNLTASYAGATYFLGSVGALNQVVHEITTTAVKSSANPSIFGNPVILTATVKASVSGIPAGSVEFLDGTKILGSATLNASGVGSITTSTLAGGSHSITAVYAGNTTYAGSTSAALSETIDTATTVTALKASLNPSTYGKPVAFTATVTSTAGTPTGTVTFYANGASLGAETLSGGIATFTTAKLTGEKNSIVAIYTKSADFAGSTSATLTEAVNPAPSVTTVKSSLNPSTYDGSVTLTATVTSIAGTPTGIVTFLSNGGSLGTGSLTGGVATLATKTLTVGKNVITASYGGSTDFAVSTSTALSEVTNATTTTVLTASPNPAAGAQTVTLKATVTAAASGPATGTVTFFNGTTKIGAGTLSAGVATMTTATLPAGTDKLTASYTASGYFLGSTSAVVSEVIQ